MELHMIIIVLLSIWLYSLDCMHFLQCIILAEKLSRKY